MFGTAEHRRARRALARLSFDKQQHPHLPVPPCPFRLILSFFSKTRTRSSNMRPVFLRHAQAPRRGSSPSRSPGKLLGWSISSRSRALPGASHLVRFFALLILLRVNVEFAEFTHRPCADVCAGNVFRVQDAFVRVALDLGEGFLLGLAIRRLRRVLP